MTKLVLGISVEFAGGCWDMQDVMWAINVEMWKVVWPITCKYELSQMSKTYQDNFHDDHVRKGYESHNVQI